MTTVTFFHDAFVAPEDARVPILDPGYLVGDGVFATMRAYDGVCFRADVHLRALASSAAAFGIALPTGFERAVEIANEAARRTSAEHAYVRVTLTRGHTSPPTVFSVIARPMVVPSEDDYRHGVATVTVRARRIPPSCFDPCIKSTSYAAQLLGRREAERAGAAEGLQRAIDGSLASGTMSNVFVMVGDTLLTPPLDTGCRDGVTRGVILELAPTLFRDVREETLPPDIFARASEAFLTSTRVECLPIASVDGVRIGASFERTHALRAAFLDLVRRETSP